MTNAPFQDERGQGGAGSTHLGGSGTTLPGRPDWGSDCWTTWMVQRGWCRRRQVDFRRSVVASGKGRRGLWGGRWRPVSEGLGGCRAYQKGVFGIYRPNQRMRRPFCKFRSNFCLRPGALYDQTARPRRGDAGGWPNTRAGLIKIEDLTKFSVSISHCCRFPLLPIIEVANAQVRAERGRACRSTTQG